MRNIFTTLLAALAMIMTPAAMSQGQITRPSKTKTNTTITNRKSNVKTSQSSKKSKTKQSTDPTLNTYNIEIIVPADTVTIQNDFRMEEIKRVTYEQFFDDNKIFIHVEQMPQFPGGDAALLSYLSTHIQYPEDAAEDDIEGQVVVRFIVTKSGEIGEVQVLRGKHPSLDAEAVRVTQSLPAFTPGKMNGEPVDVWYTLPVRFKLQR